MKVKQGTAEDREREHAYRPACIAEVRNLYWNPTDVLCGVWSASGDESLHSIWSTDTAIFTIWIDTHIKHNEDCTELDEESIATE